MILGPTHDWRAEMDEERRPSARPFLRALARSQRRRDAGHGTGLAILGAWAVLAFVLAVKRFRWV
jgi:hypothetical protein